MRPRQKQLEAEKIAADVAAYLDAGGGIKVYKQGATGGKMRPGKNGMVFVTPQSIHHRPQESHEDTKNWGARKRIAERISR